MAASNLAAKRTRWETALIDRLGMQEGKPKATLVTHFYESVLKERGASLSIFFNFLEASSNNKPKEKKWYLP